jgi:phage terminase large subunit
MLDFSFPEKLQFLLTHKARYKVAHGGRGGAKSHSFAKALILVAMERAQQGLPPIRVLCAREYQNSLADSAYKILVDIIRDNNLESFFEILHDSIRTADGGEFRFMGIMTNPTKVKSFEGVTHCWLMEAAKISKAAMKILTPTIRAPGSEIWIEFNPESADDYIYQTFVLAKVKPPRTIVVEINYPDNKWFPEELREEMEHDKATDFDEYLHVWMGKPKRVLTGAVYADEMRKAIEENRITSVPWVSDLPVHTFWDLGWNDRTAIWFVQKVSQQYHVIDFYSNRLKKISHYTQILQGRGYTYGLNWLPHDARHEGVGSDASIEKLVRRAGFKVKITPNIRIGDGINAAREIFPRCYFDENSCKDGVDALCNYHWNDKTPSAKKPVHDEFSHGADGFRYFGVAIERGVRILAGEDVDEKDSRGLAVLRAPQNYGGSCAPGDAWMA